MKRLTLAAVVLSLCAAGCDEKLNPVAPTPGEVTLVSQLSGAANVPPAGSLEERQQAGGTPHPPGGTTGRAFVP